jgi:hypothetical protein
MLSPSYSISPKDLWSAIATRDATQLVDVRRCDAYEQSPTCYLAAGLHAVPLGLSTLAGDDDHGLLERGFIVYDALFAWLRLATQERHNWAAKAA